MPIPNVCGKVQHDPFGSGVHAISHFVIAFTKV